MSWRTWLDRILGTSQETADVLDAAERVGSGFSRRQFLRTALVGAAVAATVDVEQLLWTPGEKVIFLPEVEGVVAYNDVLTPDWIAREALRILKTNMKLAARFSREYDQKYRLGDTVRVRIPKRWEPRTQSPVDKCVAVTLDEQHGCMIEPPTPEDERDRAGYIRREVEPLIDHMAWKLNEAKVDVFADLPQPRGVEQSHIVRADGVSLRGIKAYSVMDGKTLMRLDVLGGSSTRRRT